jgi:hypothetical protein
MATVTRWVDARRQVMRQEGKALFIVPGAHPRHFHSVTTTILTPQGGEVREGPGNRIFTINAQRWACAGANIAASAVLAADFYGCHNPLEQSTAVVQRGQYAGRPALVLVSRGTQDTSDGVFTFTRRLYLDPRTLLPFALQKNGRANQVQLPLERWVVTHTFIPVRAVPAHFFDPATRGRPNV